MENLEELKKFKEELLNKKSLELTGYASIDKPAERFWQRDAVMQQLPDRELTLFDYLYLNNRNFKRERALEYFGNHLTYGGLFKKIEETAKAYRTFGVNEDTNVSMCVPGIPETVYSIYALSRIGATANMMNPFMDEKTIIKTIKDTESDIIVILDSFYNEMKKGIEKSGVKQVIVVPALNSANTIVRMKQRNEKVELNSNDLTWNRFIAQGKNYKYSIDLTKRSSRTAVMVYTSGTTNAPKPIELSNYAFNSMVDMYGSTGLDFSRNQRFLHVIPTWFSTGSSNSMHLPFCNGSTVILDPRFAKELFGWKILSYKPNYSIAPTSQYETLLTNPILNNKDLSYIHQPFEGGEPLVKNTEEALNELWKEHNSDAKMQKAWGQCECGACISTTTGIWPVPDNSSGKPLPKVIVSAFDVNNGNELKYYERGELCVSTPCTMTKYFNDPIATKEYFTTDENGVKWNHTGDIGYTNEYGDVFVEGRKNDYITMKNDKIMYLFDIEKVLATNKAVQSCEVIGLTTEDNQQYPLAHIVLKDEYKNQETEIVSQLQEACEVILPEEANPIAYKGRNDFSATPGGKRDIEALQKETDGYYIIKNGEKYNVSIIDYQKDSKLISNVEKKNVKLLNLKKQ